MAAAGVPNTVGARPECIAAIIARSARGARPRVLLRSSWQSIDTGDVAHTPGALRLLERHIPTAEITLWPQPGRFSEGSREMLRRIFPRLQIVEGDITPEGKPTNTKPSLTRGSVRISFCTVPARASSPAPTWRPGGKPRNGLTASIASPS